MSDLMREIRSIADRFNEIDRQMNRVKSTNYYKNWSKKPIPQDKRVDSKDFHLTLWKGTSREEKVKQTITKMVDTRREY